jgi:hypothetical protein
MGKEVEPPKVSLLDLRDWHREQSEMYSAFGPAFELKRYHEQCANSIESALSDMATMAKAIVFLPAYQTHDDKAFNANHRSAIQIARDIQRPQPLPPKENRAQRRSKK